jgi:hypothetical protein
MLAQARANQLIDCLPGQFSVYLFCKGSEFDLVSNVDRHFRASARSGTKHLNRLSDDAEAPMGYFAYGTAELSSAACAQIQDHHSASDPLNSPLNFRFC